MASFVHSLRNGAARTFNIAKKFRKLKRQKPDIYSSQPRVGSDIRANYKTACSVYLLSDDPEMSDTTDIYIFNHDFWILFFLIICLIYLSILYIYLIHLFFYFFIYILFSAYRRPPSAIRHPPSVSSFYRLPIAGQIVHGFFLLSSSLSVALNFNSAFCCCSRGVLPGEDLYPLSESRVVVFAFVGQLHWRNLLVNQISPTV